MTSGAGGVQDPADGRGRRHRPALGASRFASVARTGCEVARRVDDGRLGAAGNGRALAVPIAAWRWCSSQTWSQTKALFYDVTGEHASDFESKGQRMPLFMDVHSIEGGVSAADVAAAHAADLATQGRHGVNYLRYWIDEEAGKVFCLVDAPGAEAANTVHRDAHGLVADEIYLVSEHS